jgi:Domain of unknown function (DUF5134)
MTPAWLLDIVAAAMLAVAALSAARLVAARPWQRGGVVIDTDVAHLLMAIAMAGMLTPRLSTLPDSGWEVIFGLLAAWFAVRVTRDTRHGGLRALAGGHCVPHFVHSASMLYMVLATTAAASPATAGMGGMDMSGTSAMTLRYPTLALLFAFILVGYSIWDLDQLSGRRYAFGAARVQGIPLPAAADSAALTVPGSAVSRGSGPTTPTTGYVRGAAGAVPGLVPGEGAMGERLPHTWGDHRGGHPPGGNRAFLLSPAVTVGCRIAMGVAMAFMLFIAI